jgi:hypothetical protein
MTLDAAANGPDAVAGLIVRRASPDDAAACHDVLWESVTDLGRRQATPLEGSVEDRWRSGESLHDDSSPSQAGAPFSAST